MMLVRLPLLSPDVPMCVYERVLPAGGAAAHHHHRRLDDGVSAGIGLLGDSGAHLG